VADGVACSPAWDSVAFYFSYKVFYANLHVINFEMILVHEWPLERLLFFLKKMH
jgi:hypothetical protein